MSDNWLLPGAQIDTSSITLSKDEFEFDTPHTRDHNVYGLMKRHEELHGNGPGQHLHEGSDQHVG